MDEHRSRDARYAKGLRVAGRQNATAFGFSVMITATFGVVSSLEPSNPPFWTALLFAAGGIVGFAAVMALSAPGGVGDEEMEGFEGLLFVAALNVVSVLAAVGASAAVAAAGNGSLIWLLAPLVASGVYLPLNGLEHSFAEAKEGDDA